MSYPGGKAGDGVYQRIINLIPPHQVYIEPFLGGAAIMRAKRPAAVNIGIDRDILALKMARLPGPPSTIAKLGAGALCYTAAEPPHGTRGDRATAYNTAHETKAVPSGSFLLFEADGIAFLESYPFEGHELVYCDPPYLLSTRTRRLYQYEMSDVDHRRLLRCLRSLPAMAMVSGYSSVLYSRELRDWHAVSFPSMTRGGTERAEWLWYNFAPPVELHDYRYLGVDFREREQIKRQKQRWQLRLKRMPTLRRQALLAAIAEASIGGFGERG